MVESRVISLASLPMDELTGVIHMYPWYGAARKELCRRMSRSGGESWGAGQYAEEALHIADRRIVSDMVRHSRDEDWSDRDVERILKSYIARSAEATPAPQAVPTASQPAPAARPSRPVAGDYFSQEAYEEVARTEDHALQRAVAAVRGEPEEREQVPDLTEVFCTETLAGIYAEQGYFAEAKRIYSKLLLAYPEKSVYFASLIEKMDILLNN